MALDGLRQVSSEGYILDNSKHSLLTAGPSGDHPSCRLVEYDLHPYFPGLREGISLQPRGKHQVAHARLIKPTETACRGGVQAPLSRRPGWTGPGRDVRRHADCAMARSPAACLRRRRAEPRPSRPESLDRHVPVRGGRQRPVQFDRRHGPPSASGALWRLPATMARPRRPKRLVSAGREFGQGYGRAMPGSAWWRARAVLRSGTMK